MGRGGGGGGNKPYTKAVKQDIFSQFFKSNNFFIKARLFPLKSEDKPNSKYISKTFSTKTVSGEKSWLLDCFLRTKVTTVICEPNRQTWY